MFESIALEKPEQAVSLEVAVIAIRRIADQLVCAHEAAEPMPIGGS